MVQVADLGDQPKDLRDSSYYVTRILNSAMAELCLAKFRERERTFNMTSLMTKEEHSELCQLIAIIFEKCVQHKTLSQNLKEFTEKNGFDLYFRFLCYLSQKSEFLGFNRLCLALVKLLSTTSYLLPDMYRTVSLCLLQSLTKAENTPNQANVPTSAQSPRIFSIMSLCRLNKFFFYDSSHKKLLADVMQQSFAGSAPSFSCTLASTLLKADTRLVKLSIDCSLLFGVTEAEKRSLGMDMPAAPTTSDNQRPASRSQPLDDENDSVKATKTKRKSNLADVGNVTDKKLASKKQLAKDDKDKKANPNKALPSKKKLDAEDGANVGGYPLDSEDEGQRDEDELEKNTIGRHLSNFRGSR